MSTFLTPPSGTEIVEPLETSQWGIHQLLRKSCEVTQALGAVLMTQVAGHESQYKSSHLVAKALAESIIDRFKSEPFSPGKPVLINKIIGMGTVLCMAVSTLLNQAENGRWNQATLIVILPAERQFTRLAVGLLEDVLDDIGLALNFYQRHAAYFNRFYEQPGLKTCLICEKVNASTGEWLRWDKFLGCQIGIKLSHTLCSKCASHHYPECAGSKHGNQNGEQPCDSIFRQVHETDCTDTCAICENLRVPTGEWLRWDEYMIRMAGANLIQTICPACSSGSKVCYVNNRGQSELVSHGLSHTSLGNPI